MSQGDVGVDFVQLFGLKYLVSEVWVIRNRRTHTSSDIEPKNKSEKRYGEMKYLRWRTSPDAVVEERLLVDILLLCARDRE